MRGDLLCISLEPFIAETQMAVAVHKVVEIDLSRPSRPMEATRRDGRAIDTRQSLTAGPSHRITAALQRHVSGDDAVKARDPTFANERWNITGHFPVKLTGPKAGTYCSAPIP